MCEIYRSAVTETVHVLELNIGINGEIFTAVLFHKYHTQVCSYSR